MPVGTQDELLRATGSTNQPFQTITTTGAGTAVFAGAGRRVDFALVIASFSGTNPTLDVKIQVSADGSTGWTDHATFAQQTADAIDTATGVVSAYPTAAVLMPADKGYFREYHTIGGTGTPTFAYALLHTPVD